MLLTAHDHGKERSPESFWRTLISVTITLGILWWGGFFSDPKVPEPVVQEVPAERDRLLSFHPDRDDFKFNTFYLGSTQKEVRDNCWKKFGKIAGENPDSLAGPIVPVCYMEHSDNVTDGYYPVYWPKE